MCINIFVLHVYEKNSSLTAKDELYFSTDG